MDMKGSTVPNSSLTRNILSSRDPEKPTMRHGFRVTLDRLDRYERATTERLGSAFTLLSVAREIEVGEGRLEGIL